MFILRFPPYAVARLNRAATTCGSFINNESNFSPPLLTFLSFWPICPFFYGSKNLSSHIHVEHFALQYSVHVRCDKLLTDIILLLVIFMILIVHYSVISIFDVLNCMSRVMLGMGQKRVPYNTLCCTTISTLMNKNE